MLQKQGYLEAPRYLCPEVSAFSPVSLLVYWVITLVF